MNYSLLKNDSLLISNIKMANTMWMRMKGLMFSHDLGGNNGLLITPCSSIHTFFMNYELDIIFLSRENEVIKIIRGMRPWRITGFYFQAKKVLELMGGTLPPNISQGDKLELVCTSL